MSLVSYATSRARVLRLSIALADCRIHRGASPGPAGALLRPYWGGRMRPAGPYEAWQGPGTTNKALYNA